MDLLEVVSTTPSALRRSGHAAIWHADRIISFGGIPHEDDDEPDAGIHLLEKDDHWCPAPTFDPDDADPSVFIPALLPPAIKTHSTFHVLNAANVVGAVGVAAKGEELLSSSTWRWVWSSEYPKSRHGHCLVPLNDTQVCVIGGRYWSDWDRVPSHDLMFDRTTRRWHILRQIVIPSRFCAAICTDVPLHSEVHLRRQKDSALNEGGGGGVVYPKQLFMFGGMSEAGELTSDIIRVSIADCVAQYLPAFGSRPPHQFKGLAVFRAKTNEILAFDGYHESGPQMARSYSLDSGVWRTICSGAPVVRSQVLPVHGGRWLLVLGGMRRKKPERRVNTAHIFDCEKQLWVGGATPLELPEEGTNVESTLGNFFAPRSAHVVIPVPPHFLNATDDVVESTPVAIVVGGSIERSDEPNNGGIAVGDIVTLRQRDPTLKWLVARLVDGFGMKLEASNALPDEEDDVLDDLF